MLDKNQKINRTLKSTKQNECGLLDSCAGYERLTNTPFLDPIKFLIFSKYVKNRNTK